MVMVIPSFHDSRHILTIFIQLNDNDRTVIIRNNITNIMKVNLKCNYPLISPVFH